MNTKNHPFETEAACEEALEVRCGVKAGMRMLVAVSGGPDSVALLHILVRLQEKMCFTLCAAHFDHQLRGEASREDARFVKQLCAELGVVYREGTADVRALARLRKKGLEEAAREARYAFLSETAEREAADLIALAHHREDQAETLLLHAVRGSDIRGLCAMRFRSGRMIRPLLDMEKAELIAYLEQRGQRYCLDATNLTGEADRNKIRLQAMPAFREINPQVSCALARLAQSAQRDEAYFEAQLDAMRLGAFQPMPYGGFFETAPLAGLPDALLSRAVLRYLCAAGAPCVSALDVEKGAALVRRLEGRVQIGGGWMLYCAKTRMHIIAAEKNAGRTEAGVPVDGPGVIQNGSWKIVVREAKAGETGDGVRTQVLDWAQMDGAQLRAYRPGDVFTPLGMQGTQKMKKTFAGAGIEQPLRPYVPLIARGSRVLWLIGVRPAQTAAVTACTRRAMHITWIGELPFGGFIQTKTGRKCK